MKKISQILIAAKKLISDRDKFTTGALARDDRDFVCATNDVQACKFCSMGAVGKVSGEPAYHVINRKVSNILDIAARQVTNNAYHDIENVNDFLDHETVMQVFDVAIEIAKESE